ncbi:unnamed protein product [Clonostachys chloroleuca]|uniref:Uncharacterized protein n=1 Tax=Clonostachys chloroleuca TaxID=1926264 RepID=A0AA35VLV3_9HYPO|nr:unnamed protein product [Clonostachys chloroleuca]
MDMDYVALWGTIGTWFTAILATIALISIVPPSRLFLDRMKERNRAFNAAHDIYGDYITKGVGFGREFRIFRKPKVPTLAPTYDFIADEPTVIVIPGADKRWSLQLVNKTSCRTGWARFCRLIEAYSVTDGPVRNKAADGRTGRLKFADGRTWLPVSRYWVLTLGLLGRYGERRDKGNFHPSALRRDLDEERLLVSTNSTSKQYDSDTDDASLGSEISDIYSTSVYTNRRANTIRGITGTIRKLKPTSPGVDGHTLGCPLSFELRNRSEIGEERKDEVNPLSSLFWLAAGFLPLSNDPQDSIVASLEDPVPRDCAYFKLHETEGYLPVSVWRPVKALKIDKTKILSLHVVPEPTGDQWTSIQKRGEKREYHLLTENVQRLVCAMLTMEWDCRGYLLWKRNTDIWTTMLGQTASLLRVSAANLLDQETINLGKDLKALCRTIKQWPSPRRHRLDVMAILSEGLRASHTSPESHEPDESDESFDHGNTADLLKLSNKSLELLEALVPKAVRISIAMLVITNQQFREKVKGGTKDEVKVTIRPEDDSGELLWISRGVRVGTSPRGQSQGNEDEQGESHSRSKSCKRKKKKMDATQSNRTSTGGISQEKGHGNDHITRGDDHIKRGGDHRITRGGNNRIKREGDDHITGGANTDDKTDPETANGGKKDNKTK